MKLKLRETSGWDFEDEQLADAYLQTSEEDITESESEIDEQWSFLFICVR